MTSQHLREVAGEGILLAGGGAAILLQVAHPLVAAGVARHSTFAERPMHRLTGTMRYVYSVVFADEGPRDHARGWVNRAHAAVPHASDAGPQLWVAATLYRMASELHERTFGPMPPEVAEEVYRGYAVLGTSLRLPPDAWPADRAAFERYWGEAVAALEVGNEARSIARTLLTGRNKSWWLRLAMPLVRLVTAGLLPAELRRAYRLPWSRARARRFERTMWMLTRCYRVLPRRVRRAPVRHYLGDAAPPGSL